MIRAEWVAHAVALPLAGGVEATFQHSAVRGILKAPNYKVQRKEAGLKDKHRQRGRNGEQSRQ